jgi:hypothetical protein
MASSNAKALDMPPSAPQAAPAVPPMQLAENGHPRFESPARALQAKLEANLLEPLQDRSAAAAPRWPLYVGLPLWLAVSGLLWWGIAVGLGALFSR